MLSKSPVRQLAVGDHHAPAHDHVPDGSILPDHHIPERTGLQRLGMAGKTFRDQGMPVLERPCAFTSP